MKKSLKIILNPILEKHNLINLETNESKQFRNEP